MLEIDPIAVASSGISEDRLRLALGLVDDWVGVGVLPGASLVIARGDHLVSEGYWGQADLKTKRAASRDTLWSIASITKPVTAAAVMACVDRGLLRLDAPIAESLPEFNAPGDVRPWRGEVTLRHLLTHTAGFSYEAWNANTLRYVAATGMPSTQTGKLAALRLPLAFDPGDKWEYGINIDWVGRIVEAVSGQSLDDYLRDRIFAPLGNTNNTPPSLLCRLNTLIWRLCSLGLNGFISPA